jgi:threonine synthase
MKFKSTNNKSEIVSFRSAVLQGIADDGGLFLPIEFNKLDEDFIKNITSYSFQETSLEIAKLFSGDDIPETDLKNIVYDAINFPAPLAKLNDELSVLELFHGPTFAFKDFGARFLAKTSEYFLKNENKKTTILVATSGDTGSAVANGFYGLDNIDVVLLYPSGKVSNIQEKQLTTLDKNITAVEVEGTFDDCQRFVKQAFADEALKKKMTLSSANSINIARLIPQSFYYFNAYAQIQDKSKPVIFSVPSGNFGNLTAGLFAKNIGLPVEKFIAAVNANDVFPKYLDSGEFTAKPSVKTLSNAMDVGNPSNLARINSLFMNNVNSIRDVIFSKSFSDKQTLEEIESVYKKYNYIIDPHGAVGTLAVKEYQKVNNDKSNYVVLETAHPAKFLDVFSDEIKSAIVFPEKLKECLQKEKRSVKIPNDFNVFKNYLLEKN